MKTTSFIILIFILVVVINFIKIEKKEVVYVRSDIDNNLYLVRDLEDKQKAANLLARIRANIIYFTNHLNENKEFKYSDNKKFIDQLYKRIKNCDISESGEDSVYTSYSVNKGEQIVFCVRSKKFKNKIHNLNLLTYVMLHELAHVACPEYGHTSLFKEIFAFFTKTAIELNIYKKVNFREDPNEYCGLTITNSIV